MTGSADLVGLRAIAEAATPSVWHVVSEALDQGSPWVENEKGWTVAETGGHLINARNNAHYIATFSPAVVIALIDRLVAAEANLLAVRGALEEAEVWLTACLECETWQWDADQHDAATACQDRARSALSASQSQPCADGERAARIEAEPSGAEPLSTSERHELECLRHQVGQLEYPCSPHCEGYLRELAMRNGGSRP